MNQIIVQTLDDIKQIPIDDIEILIVGTTRVAITSYAIMMCIKSNVKIIFTDEHSSPIGEIDPYYSNHDRNRHILSQISWSSTKKNLLWQQITICKIRNQANLLNKLALDGESIYKLSNQVENGDSDNREAVAARMYFPRLFGDGFTRRNSEDDINGILNYGYSVLLSSMNREINAAGYFTNLGIHHKGIENQFNLASDLIEVFRPFVDEIAYKHAIEMLNQNIKIELIDVLNHSFILNDKETLVSNAMTEIVRDSVSFLDESTPHLLAWKF
ncbi:type II CRISPR-associated endonuclease Cas1 [Oenococcus sicerae]|nr:type II CRISPR-associated endonuclease Cas1 [Oenococcus sicerae]